MSASVSPSPHGFVVVRGRGYRPGQVERYAAVLFQDRDAAWERAARLTVLAKEMEGEAARLRERVAGLSPQTYDTLGPRAQHLLAVVEEEAAELAAAANATAGALCAAAAAEAAGTRDAAAEYDRSLRADVEADAQRVLLGAQRTADEERIAARQDVKERRGDAVAALQDMRRRTAQSLADQEKEHAQRRESAERDIAQREAELDARNAELAAYAEGLLADARRGLAETEAADRGLQEEAEAGAAELLSRARVHEGRVVRETERLLREHDDAREEMQAHMNHIRTSLATLTGRTPAEG
ncbi:cellulose-binding protein [Streptomyces hypolithicus]